LHIIEHTAVKIVQVFGTQNFQWNYQNFSKNVKFAQRSIYNFSWCFFGGGRNFPEILQKVLPKNFGKIS